MSRLIRMAAGMRPDKEIRVQKIRVGNVPVLILRPKKAFENQSKAALLWLHGGGYFLGMKEMVYISRAADLVKKFGVTVVSPGYRLAAQAPYPAALKDCWQTLVYMDHHAKDLGIDADRIMVGGESAGGGLAAALCMLARDRGTVKIVWQFPLYPMISCYDTESSRNNHGRVWNTRRNHLGWKLYLRNYPKAKISPYASPALRKDYRGLPPAYTFVGDGEPFYGETMEYIRKLQEAGVEATVDVYHTDMHAFDMMRPEEEVSRKAVQKFEENFRMALERISGARES